MVSFSQTQHYETSLQQLFVSVQADEIAEGQREEPAAEADASDRQGSMTAVLVPPHRVSVMWTAWVFFKTFFSSLIPEVAQGVANWPSRTDTDSRLFLSFWRHCLKVRKGKARCLSTQEWIKARPSFGCISTETETSLLKQQRNKALPDPRILKNCDLESKGV